MKRTLSIITFTLAIGALGACDLAQSPIGPLDIDIEQPAQDCANQDDPTCPPPQTGPPDTTPPCGPQDSRECQLPPDNGPTGTAPCESQDSCPSQDG